MAKPVTLPRLPRGIHYATPGVRRAIGEQLAAAHRAGMSIREIAQHVGRSYGFVHALLVQHGDLGRKPAT